MPCGKLSKLRLTVPLYQNQLVTTSKKIASRRPMISVWIRCICLELADSDFSSKLNILRLETMKTEDDNNSPEHDQRPWGSFTVLDESDDYKVKRLEVLPRKRLSYQRHAHRAEHWHVVRGIAKVTLNGNEILVKKGESLDVATGDAHRIENPDPSELLILIESQTGSYFGEDDIERLEDDFGRS